MNLKNLTTRIMGTAGTREKMRKLYGRTFY